MRDFISTFIGCLVAAAIGAFLANASSAKESYDVFQAYKACQTDNCRENVERQFDANRIKWLELF